MASNNKNVNITEIHKLFKKTIENITPSDWKKVVDHTKKDAWAIEGLLMEAMEEMIININSNDSDTSSEEGNWDSSCENESALEDRDYDSDSDLSGLCPLSPKTKRVLDFTEFLRLSDFLISIMRKVVYN